MHKKPKIYLIVYVFIPSMKYTTARQGRIFVVRLQDHDVIHESIQKLAEKENIKRAAVIALGGADKESKVISGPKQGRADTIEPIQKTLSDVHEFSAVGTIFPDKEQKPILHMHSSFGRDNNTITGCIRKGVNVWHVGEVIVIEILDNKALRKKDAATGFELLDM